MTARLRALLALLLAGCGGAALLVVGAAAPASACDCSVVRATTAADTGPLRSEADVVLAGTLVGRREPLLGGADALATLTFEVDTVYKGRATRRQQVRTPADGASCGLELEADRRYLVFATADGGGRLVAEQCGGATPVTQVAATWSGRAPEPGGPSAGGSVLPAAGTLVAASLTVGTVAVLVRRRRRFTPPE